MRSAGLIVTERPLPEDPKTARERLDIATDAAIAGCGGSIDKAIATLSAAVAQDAGMCGVVFAPVWQITIGNIIRKTIAMRGTYARYRPHVPHVPEVPDQMPPEPPPAILPDGAAERVRAQEELIDDAIRLRGTPAPARPQLSVVETERARPQDSGSQDAGGPALPLGERHPHTGGAVRQPSHRNAAALVAVARVASRTILDTHHTELGRPLGDCCKADLVDLAGRSRRRGAFYAALAEKLPEEGLVRAHARAEDVEAMWAAIFMANTQGGA